MPAMPRFALLSDCLTVDTGGDPGEVLKVKRLPGRAFDGEVWTVPILPGLADALISVYGEEAQTLASEIHSMEDCFLSSLEVAGPVDPFKIEAVEAANVAMTHKLFTKYHGDKGQYNKVYYPLFFGE